MHKQWGGRFEGATDALMEQFNASIGFDWRLYAVDIRGSLAYAAALEAVGLLTPNECAQLTSGLHLVEAEFDAGGFVAGAGDEDIHTAVERRLYALVGPVAGKLHTGRSRNDQVATDLRLYTREQIDGLDKQLCAVQTALLRRAEEVGEALMPGYTHLQRAQPVLVAHWLLSLFWPLQRDRERLTQARQRVNVLPLGAGALAGNALGIDRQLLAQLLEFDALTPNSMDAVADRDFVAEVLFAGALIGTHLSRLAEDLILYSSAEWGFVTVADSYSTGSSLMPQKKNPDSLELTRGKSGRLLGNLVALLTTLKGLPSTYNKDLQEDKEPLFDTFDTLALTLPVVAGVVTTLQFHLERMASSLDDGMLATDVADMLVRAGVPFREAHGLVGQLVRRGEVLELPLRELPAAELVAVHPALTEHYESIWDPHRSVAQRMVVGGTAPAAIKVQLAAAHAACGITDDHVD
ncbi:MAG: argininosuccinate lyase [Herpetosiphonaceae bacterium]|nr:argininosuccinate lyase [Herpetosiphonaceae bacterium]